MVQPVANPSRTSASPSKCFPPRERNVTRINIYPREREQGRVKNSEWTRDTDLELEGGTTCLLRRYEGESLRKAGRVSPNTVDLGFKRAGYSLDGTIKRGSYSKRISQGTTPAGIIIWRNRGRK